MTGPGEHVPDRVEKIGRRLKMEYFGMGGGFFVVFCLFLLRPPAAYAPVTGWSTDRLPAVLVEPSAVGRALLATLAFFELFLAVKKKTKDHISASFLLLATALVVREGVAGPGAGVALACLGFLLAALEGSIEKRKGRVFILPVLFWVWAQAHPTFLLGLAVPLLYLLPARERQVNRRRIAALWAVSALACCASLAGPLVFPAAARLLLRDLGLATGASIPAIAIVLPSSALALVLWRLLLPVHCGLLFLCAAAALSTATELAFVCLVPVALAGSLFRNSIHFDAMRPAFKRAEWYYFWAIVAVALVLLARLPSWEAVAGP